MYQSKDADEQETSAIAAFGRLFTRANAAHIDGARFEPSVKNSNAYGAAIEPKRAADFAKPPAALCIALVAEFAFGGAHNSN
jgi:hypothetical protein